MNKRRYEVVPGFFIQDEQAVEEAIPPRFGLIDNSPDRWTAFSAKIRELNETAAPGVHYKIFFFGRHGQGYHNVGEEKYGTADWVKNWVELAGDGELVWGPDARLTPLGEQQARDAQLAWKTERSFGVPVPGKVYTSPLTRAIQTNQLTFDDAIIPGLEVTVVENAREYFGIFTPDKRRTRSEIHAEFPEYVFEHGFTQDDLLWTAEYREVHEDVVERCKKVLDMIFDNDEDHQVISITSHGGFIGALLTHVNHHPWTLPTGGIIPVVLKGSIITEVARELRN